MNETFLTLSMCLCIGLFWAILFLFRASSSDVVKEYLRNQGFYDSKDY